MPARSPISGVNDFVVRFANVNGSGSASANELFARAVLRMGVPVSSRNIFPSNIQGLPTWFEVRICEDGHLGARGGVDLMVAMNPQTWDKDVASIEPGGYLFYDSTKPMPETKFRSDIVVLGVPLTAICNREYTDPRQRQLFKNIIYLGALAALLDIETEVIEALFSDQFKGKEKLIGANRHALHLGRDWVLLNMEARPGLERVCGLRVKRADKVGDRIFLDGNSAAALGAVYGGATVCAWYPLTPSSSLADAFTNYCAKLRRDPATGKARYAIIQGEDEIASIGIVVGAGWNGARAFTATSGPGISLMQEFCGLAVFCRDSDGDFRCPARRPVNWHADAHPAVRCVQHCLRLAWRHQARGAVPGKPGRNLRVRRALVRPCRTAADAGVRAARSRDRDEPAPYGAARLGRSSQIRPRQADDRGRPRCRTRLRPLSRCRRRRHPVPHAARHAPDRAARSSPAGPRATAMPGTPRMATPMSTTCSACCASSRLPRRLVPRPILRRADKATRYGVIYYGSTAPAMDEAIGMLEARGNRLDTLRVRAFPFHQDVPDFIAEHDFVFLVEQNRDAQLRSLIINECGIDPVRLVPILHYDGTPITARFIAGAIAKNLDAVKSAPLRVVG